MNKHASSLKLRPEQQDAIERTYSYWQKSIGLRRFLWNAKPRFGKTISAYHFALKINADRVLIVTNRPVVSDAWARDFFQYIKPRSNYIFASAKGGEIECNNEKYHIYSRAELINNAQLLHRPLIFFISLQDLKGKEVSSDVFKTQNQWIFQLDKPWDLLIIDEGHEGIKTSKTQHLLEKLHTNFTLYLSGTPFRAVANQDFSQEQIYNWSYLDEQKSLSTRPELSPRIKFYTTTLKDFSQISSSSTNLYDLGEFFCANSAGFIHQDSVLNWLDKIKSIYTQPDPESGYLRHSFWLLSGVNECIAMQKLLQSHPYFKSFTIILAAGRADSYRSDKLLTKIRAAISDNPFNTRTITLSCGQLTTGITIPEWTTVFMLYNNSDLARISASQYLQAVFRTQNPWAYRHFQKENCLVFDFAPDRALTVIRDYATNLCNVDHQLSELDSVTGLLDHLDISLIEQHKTKQISAEEVINLPRQIIAQEIVDGAFISSNKLFNFRSFSHMSESAQEIISKFSAAPKQRFEITPHRLKKSPNNFDEQGTLVPNTEFLLQAYDDVLKRGKYAKLNQEQREILQTLATIEDTEQLSGCSEIVHDAFTEIHAQAYRRAIHEQHNFENDCRDKLRSFVRTIPLLLHIYGKPDIELKDLLELVPDDYFKFITHITKQEFQILLQEKYFHEQNCTVAMREFMHREKSFSDYFLRSELCSIFNYIPTQNSEQIFTPSSLVIKMVDYLEKTHPNIFQSTDAKFFDPASKSGLFLAEILRRLFLYTRPKFTSDHDCLYHILTQQIYAWSPHEIYRLSTLNTLLSFSRFATIQFSDTELAAISRNFRVVSALESNYQNNPQERSQDMKFDVIIGNPPYRSGRRQVYADFYKLAVDLDPELLCMVFPIGWQKPHNHNGLGRINNAFYKRDPHIVSLDHYYEKGKNRIFPEIGTGGINIILRDREYDNHGKIRKLEYGRDVGVMTLSIQSSEVTKPQELTTLIDLLKDFPKVEPLGSSRKPYGFYADPLRNPEKYHLQLRDRREKTSDVRLFGLFADGKRGYKFIPRADLPKESRNLDRYKLFVPKAWGNMSDSIGLGGSYANICVARPGDVCSETFIEFGPFSNHDETIKMAKYFMTKFFRALLFLAKDSQNTARDKYKYIPVPDLSLPFWQHTVADLDQALFDYYDIPHSSRDFILQNIQPRNESNIEIL